MQENSNNSNMAFETYSIIPKEKHRKNPIFRIFYAKNNFSLFENADRKQNFEGRKINDFS